MVQEIILGIDNVKLQVYKLAILNVREKLLELLKQKSDAGQTTISITELLDFSQEISELTGHHLINGNN